MNKFFKTIVLTIFSFFVFVGCSGKDPILEGSLKVKKEDKVLTVKQKVNPFNETLEKEGRTKNQRFIIATGIALDVVLKEIAEETLRQGDSHFVIINDDVNGFLGFSLNNKKDLLEYCLGDMYTDKELNGKCRSTVDWYFVEIKALLGSNFHYTIASWDAKKVLEEINSSSLK